MDGWIFGWMDGLIERTDLLERYPFMGVYFTQYPIRIFRPTVPDITSKVNRCNETTVKR